MIDPTAIQARTLAELFAEPGPATFTDVLNGYGLEKIWSMTSRYLKDDVLFPAIDTTAKAELHTWVHLRGVIDRERQKIADQKKREDEYRGDVLSRSPLNPFRNKQWFDQKELDAAQLKANGGTEKTAAQVAGKHDESYPPEFDNGQADRDNYDTIGR